MFRKLKAATIAFCLLVPVATGCAAQKAGIRNLGFAIQVGAFSDVRNAERLTAKLQKKGIEAFYFKKENGIYAVRFGDFERKEEASRAARKLVSERVIGPYFIAAPRPEGRRMEPVLEKAPAPSLRKAPPERQAKVEPRKEQEPREQEHRRREVEARKDRNDMGFIAARTAERFVGIPYRWGGDTVVDGMDCSGFVRAVYNLCGVNIPRTSREQFRVGDAVGKDELKDGDLVFFGASEDQITHVGIFVGGGRFVHAPKRGDDIKVSTIDEGYFQKRFVGAKRYF
ncbi:NlpC/P60 family protein [Geomesophilobacter sediminis]|uniref:C40 family peptidase n=1 Tax=Geomesophilobacter sediminis TaxID=2798584 RepID=A0A8J7S7B6_9BACT|nr:NlpC/P60 family protein [Geomesophilobacter sediminis]MBJ6726941.1 C40 family peptidase [Geomesophilobacter sediminis]